MKSMGCRHTSQVSQIDGGFFASMSHDFVEAEAHSSWPGTKSQLTAMKTRNPVPMPNVAGEPIACKITRLQKPPTKRATMPMIL